MFVLAQWPDAAVEDAVRAGLSEFEKRVALTFVTDRSVPLLLSAIKGIPGRSLVLYIRAPAESPPLTPLPGEMARLVAEVSPVPVYSSSQASVGSGVVGGVTYHVRTLGTRVGELAATILDGARPQDIPIEHAALVPIVDWRQLQRWGIAEDALPPGSFVLFRDTSLWQQYRPYIITGAALLIAQTVLIAGLLFQRAKRRQAEADLRGSYERIRNLGGRLLSAQEAERAHLARELHDDVGQQMSILQMDLETLRCRRGESIQDNELLAEASERAATAAKSLRELSHRLHPANLRLLGLTTALQSLQRELSSSGVAIAFSHDDVPASLSQNVMMCFYRVAQEALSNAIKHAGADNVSICLRGDPGGLIMTIDDNGVGFDVRQVPRGLGLISMTERIEQLGGTLQIRSEIGGGTHLEASVSSAAGGAVAAGAP